MFVSKNLNSELENYGFLVEPKFQSMLDILDKWLNMTQIPAYLVRPPGTMFELYEIDRENLMVPMSVEIFQHLLHEADKLVYGS